MTPATRSETSAKDFASDQDVRWCPGCGDYAILKGVQKTLADVGASTENTVFVSGIGCAARFPYYMSTYGFHTIHGRAPALATGLKLANPDLDVWVVTGGRRAQHRRQPHAARSASKCRPADPPVQQRDLRTDQGPGIAHVPARHRHAFHAPRLLLQSRPSRLVRDRRRSPVCRPGDRYQPEAAHGSLEGCSRAPRRLVRGDLPKLHRVQRRVFFRVYRQGSCGFDAARRRKRKAAAVRAGWQQRTAVQSPELEARDRGCGPGRRRRRRSRGPR